MWNAAPFHMRNGRTPASATSKPCIAAARATSYSPYLGADLPGTGTTAYRFSFAEPERLAAARTPLSPKAGALAAAGVALLLLLAHAAPLWRAS